MAGSATDPITARKPGVKIKHLAPFFFIPGPFVIRRILHCRDGLIDRIFGKIPNR
jgi:hypothetical protein